MPEFMTISETEMAKAKSYATGPTKAELALRKEYDNYVTSLAPGSAGKLVLDLSPGEDGKPRDNSRSVAARIRRAAKRSGINIGKLVSTGDTVQFTVSANGAKSK